MRNKIASLFNLGEGEQEVQKTLENVKSNVSFRGSNLWILACAIMVASVGLNVNSTAVIIGAMLISPLMGPIVGAGFALGIYDFVLLKKSLKNLAIATIVSLLVASLYFFLSPLKEVQSELLARTTPNIYDVLIAFFGGLVGVIAITRVEKGNPIPGVAIATALMPPLCTAGFGLATGNWKFFFGALFLYSINCVFICIATFSIVKYLKYPATTNVNPKYQQRIKYGVTALILVILIPSIFFAYTLYKEQKFNQQVNMFINKEFLAAGSTMVYKNIDYYKKPKTIEVAFLRRAFSDTAIEQINERLRNFGLKNTKLFIRKNTSDNLQGLKNEVLTEIKKLEIELHLKDLQIASLEKNSTTIKNDNAQLYSELHALFPGVQSASFSQHNFHSGDSTWNSHVLLYSAKPKLNKKELETLYKWMLQKFKLTKVEIVESGK